MTRLFLHLPPRTGSPEGLPATALECRFACLSTQGVITQEGRRPLSALADYVAQAEQVVVLLAASDVTLLHSAVPPLPAAKLKAALPFLVEEQLLADPADCVIAVGPRIDGMRLLAVVQRDWLEQLVAALSALGARALQVLPAALCLPLDGRLAVAAIGCHGGQGEFSLRLSEQGGLGLAVVTEPVVTSAREAVAMLRALLPDLSNANNGAVRLYVPAAHSAAYAELLHQLAPGVKVLPDSWQHWIAGADACKLDLLAALGSKVAGQRRNWRAWRRPLAWACALLVLQVAALNLDWWRLSHEGEQLTASMRSAYRTAYPKESLIVDPLAQARQKIALSSGAGEQLAADDFIALAAQFNLAWQQLGAKKADVAIAALEYRDRSLLVRLTQLTQLTEGVGGSARKLPDESLSTALKAALASYRLALSEAAPGVWRITANGDDK